MLKFGESYVLTLKENIMLPSGRWIQTLFGDFKGIESCEITNVKWLHIGDTYVDASLVRSFVKSQTAITKGVVETEWFYGGEVIHGKVTTPIGNAHSV